MLSHQFLVDYTWTKLPYFWDQTIKLDASFCWIRRQFRLLTVHSPPRITSSMIPNFCRAALSEENFCPSASVFWWRSRFTFLPHGRRRQFRSRAPLLTINGPRVLRKPTAMSNLWWAALTINDFRWYSIHSNFLVEIQIRSYFGPLNSPTRWVIHSRVHSW